MASESKWKIKVKTLKSDSFELNIDADATVDELKKQIEKIKNVTPNLQRLIFRGRILKTKTKLTDYEICNGSTVHLVARKPSTANSQNSQNSQSNSQNTAQQTQQQSTTNTNPSNPSNPMGFNINAIQQMFQNLASQQQSNGGAPMMGPIGRVPMGPMPQMVIRRMPINASGSNTVRNIYDNKEEEEEEENITIKKAEYNNDINDDNDGSTNLIKWKLKKLKIQNWIKNGKKYACYFSDEYELNNGSIWRFFIYPNGINQAGYHDDCVLFIMLEELPFGVESIDVEFAMHYKPNNVNFKFRKTFNNFINSAGWPRNFLSLQKILQLPSNKNYVKFSCDLIIHSVEFNGDRMSNIQYIKWKQMNPQNCFSMKYNKKPNGRLFRWKLDKKVFIDAQFKQYQQSKTLNVNGFKWYIQIYPNGLNRTGFVQPYLHLIKMPHSVNKIDAHFSFYFKEINIGYSHIDTFNGKMGKGWPDMKLSKNEIKWNELKSITIHCRINILNISINNIGYFNNDKKKKKEEKEEKEEKKDDDNDTDDDDEEEDDDQLKKWLNDEVGLGQYFDKFIENEIHSLDDIVEYIEDKNNLTEIGIKPFAHKAKIWKFIVKLKEIRQITNDDDEASTF